MKRHWRCAMPDPKGSLSAPWMDIFNAGMAKFAADIAKTPQSNTVPVPALRRMWWMIRG